ncbi:Gfo/Idh/MocA family oxidoreductase [Verrucomicrobia bacterium]|nr:Gfo/Idh/MocA family oxidoreductase [Verrucomicrobiota bacterium]
MTDKIIKRDLALIGAGYWGKNLARNFNQIGVLHTICDENKSLLKNFKQDEYSGVKLTTDINQVLENECIDKIAIAAPAGLHYEIAKVALSAGKDVFVEKPLCLDIDHAKELVEYALKTNKVLMVGHLLQYHPCVEKIQSILSLGELGKLQYISSNRLNLGKIRKEENALWSFAPHDLSVILSLTGDELPDHVQCVGGSYLTHGVADTTMTTMRFPNDIRAHVHVSWLNPFKEQKLTVVGSHGMLVFDDTKSWGEKLALFRHHLLWEGGRTPTPQKKVQEYVEVEELEPLKRECEHFLECCSTRLEPKTDGPEGIRVLSLLQAAQKSLENDGKAISAIELSKVEDAENGDGNRIQENYYVDPTAVIDDNVKLGEYTKIWHFSHICSGAEIGDNCNIGQNVMIGTDVQIGRNVKIQNNVSIYTGVTIEDDAFLGPSCVFTNVSNPRSQVNRKSVYEKTRVKKGATIGANATIIPGITLGYYSFISAGAVITKDVPDYAFMKGVPAKQVGWMSRHGHPLVGKNNDELICPESGLKYSVLDNELKCVDIDEKENLPLNISKGKASYRTFKGK